MPVKRRRSLPSVRCYPRAAVVATMEIQPTRRVAAAPAQALPVINATVSGRTVSVSVSGSLANPGSAALVQASSVQPNVFLVFRDSTAAFTVLTAVCTTKAAR